MASLKNTFNIFFWGTFGFFILKYTVKTGNTWVWTTFYIMISILLMYFVNMGVFQDKCGFSDAWAVFKATLIPWVLIFGMMVTLINIYPGWKSPFSNTVGYMFALLSPSVTELKTYVDEQYELVIKDPLLFINEINMNNVEDVVASDKHMNIFNDENKEKAKVLIRNLVFLKELISEWVWFMLTGFVTISTSHNLLANTPCKTSVDQQSKTYNKQIVEEDDTPVVTSSRVYTENE